MSPASQGGFFITRPAGKPRASVFALITIHISIITGDLLSHLCVGLGQLWLIPFPELTASGQGNSEYGKV